MQNISDKIEKGMTSVIKGAFPLFVFLTDMMKACFKKGVFLKPLAGNFLRLALQIVNRFCNFLEAYTKCLNIDENSFNQEKVCFLANEVLKIVDSLTLGEFSFPLILVKNSNILIKNIIFIYLLTNIRRPI